MPPLLFSSLNKIGLPVPRFNITIAASLQLKQYGPGRHFHCCGTPTHRQLPWPSRIRVWSTRPTTVRDWGLYAMGFATRDLNAWSLLPVRPGPSLKMANLGYMASPPSSHLSPLGHPQGVSARRGTCPASARRDSVTVDTWTISSLSKVSPRHKQVHKCGYSTPYSVAPLCTAYHITTPYTVCKDSEAMSQLLESQVPSSPCRPFSSTSSSPLRI